MMEKRDNLVIARHQFKYAGWVWRRGEALLVSAAAARHLIAIGRAELKSDGGDMSNGQSGLLKMLCPTCRTQSPVLVGREYRWRCDHRKITIVENGSCRYLVYDQNDSRPKRWPQFDSSGHGPFVTR